MLNRLIFIFSLVGLAISVYLSYEYTLPTSIYCPVGGSGCETVRQSIYSKLVGIPIPSFGILFYLFNAIITILILEVRNKILSIFRLLSTVVAFAFSAYLTSLEAYVIKAYCFWCVSSAVVTTIILILVIIDRINYKNRLNTIAHTAKLTT
ncbi:MAG: vitamin K epoxide reductase family protein [Patescibacteria group bacterium]|nr:vitamin K epoxide reductase family protein [Patescibacteria group bacterium]